MTHIQVSNRREKKKKVLLLVMSLEDTPVTHSILC